MNTESSSAGSAPAATSGSTAPNVYVPGNFWPKVIYLIVGGFIMYIGGMFLWEPLGRMWLGETVTARVAEIRVVEPGQPDVVYKSPRNFDPEPNLAITFQHYVEINFDGHPKLFRISVDSRKAPIPELMVNENVPVAYYPDDERRIAFAYKQVRTWGIGGMIMGIGMLFWVTGVPMLLAVGKPIIIDPEAPAKNKGPSTDAG